MKWGTIYKSKDDLQAYLVANWLRERGFEVAVLSKKDSMFSMLGRVEVQVPKDQFPEASKALEGFFEDEEEE